MFIAVFFLGLLAQLSSSVKPNGRRRTTTRARRRNAPTRQMYVFK